MHSSIIQLSSTPIKPNNRLDETTLEDYSEIDYCSDVNEEYRQAVIDNLVNGWTPKGMFSMADEPDCIIYNGGLDEWIRREWLPQIRTKANNLSTHNIFKGLNLYKYQKLLGNCLDLGTLFYLSEDNHQGFAEKSTAFVEYLSTLTPGTRLYIGGVLDYHW